MVVAVRHADQLILERAGPHRNQRRLPDHHQDLARGSVVEARLHGAWPLVEITADPAEWRDALDEGPTVVVVRGELPPALAALPEL